MAIETVRVVPPAAVVVFVLVLVRARFARVGDAAESGRRAPLLVFDDTPAAPAGDEDTPAAPAAATAAELPAPVCWLF